MKRLVQEFQKQARIAFFGQDFKPTAQAVRAAREAHEAANVPIGKVLQSLSFAMLSPLNATIGIDHACGL